VYETCPDCTAAHSCYGCSQALTHDGGSATRLGVEWADRTAKQVGLARDWPAYEGRVAEIARRMIGELGRTEERREELAGLCAARAARRWRWLQGRA
jgi:hypothetical protein